MFKNEQLQDKLKDLGKELENAYEEIETLEINHEKLKRI